MKGKSPKTILRQAIVAFKGEEGRSPSLKATSEIEKALSPEVRFTFFHRISD